MFIISIKTTSLSSEEEIFLKKYYPWGVILFLRNIESKHQVKELISEIKKIHSDIKILIDEEGGMVSRIKNILDSEDLYNPQNTSKYYGDLYLENPELAKKELYNNYALKTKLLLDLGIDINCAPVCDICGGYLSIYDRAFSSDPEIVKILSKIAIKAITDKGGIATIKHIPGHGLTIQDSHITLPIVELSKEQFFEQEAGIFKYLSDEFADKIAEKKVIAMTAHIIYQCLDGEKPATLSKKVINYIREEIGFKGILITDAIEMRALHQTFEESSETSSVEDIVGKQTYYKAAKENLSLIAVESLEAGCDIILYCEPNIENAEYIATSIREFGKTKYYRSKSTDA
jgi:beta-N-acetylhexosaminidase